MTGFVVVVCVLTLLFIVITTVFGKITIALLRDIALGTTGEEKFSILGYVYILRF